MACSETRIKRESDCDYFRMAWILKIKKGEGKDTAQNKREERKTEEDKIK